jgi:hypothetical protein
MGRGGKGGGAGGDAGKSVLLKMTEQMRLPQSKPSAEQIRQSASHVMQVSPALGEQIPSPQTGTKMAEAVSAVS